MKQKLTFEIECGEKTCAYDVGDFCEFAELKRFGTIPVCRIFNEELQEKGGWLQRCPECLERGEDSSKMEPTVNELKNG